MTVTTAKEFMQVIAKHYEKCRGIYLHTMYNIKEQGRVVQYGDVHKMLMTGRIKP